MHLSSFCPVLNIAVFVKEGKGNLLSLDNGRQTLAGEIKQMMMDVLSIPYKFNDVFAVWLISPLLGWLAAGLFHNFTLHKKKIANVVSICPMQLLVLLTVLSFTL